jgi:hypothetical protein
VRFLVGLAAVFAGSTLVMSGLLQSVVYGELVGYLSLSIEVIHMEYRQHWDYHSS